MVVRPIAAQRASEKGNSIDMPYILDPATFSYILNAKYQQRPREMERAQRAYNSSADGSGAR